MKYAYYVVASSDEEKKMRLKQIEKVSGQDPEYCASYIDVAPRYDAPQKELRALCSLKAAIRKGRIQTLVIHSLENLHMEEERALCLLMGFMRRGVQIALDEPSNIQTEDSLYGLAFDAQLTFIEQTLRRPLFEGECCYIYSRGKSAFVYLERDCKEHSGIYSEKVPFIDAVSRYEDTGFFLFRSDKNGWYHISDYMANAILQYHGLVVMNLYMPEYDDLILL